LGDAIESFLNSDEAQAEGSREPGDDGGVVAVGLVDDEVAGHEGGGHHAAVFQILDLRPEARADRLLGAAEHGLMLSVGSKCTRSSVPSRGSLGRGGAPHVVRQRDAGAMPMWKTG